MPIGKVHDAESPSRRIRRILSTEPFDAVHLLDSGLAETLTQVGERRGAVAQRAGHTSRAGDVWRCEHQIEMEGEKRRRCRHSVQYQCVLHGLVADEQVVVDLHDDQAPGRKKDSGPLREIVHPAPGAQKVSSGSAASPARAVPGRGPPKHVQPLPPSLSRSTDAADDGGTRKSAAW